MDMLWKPNSLKSFRYWFILGPKNSRLRKNNWKSANSNWFNFSISLKWKESSLKLKNTKLIWTWNSQICQGESNLTNNKNTPKTSTLPYQQLFPPSIPLNKASMASINNQTLAHLHVESPNKQIKPSKNTFTNQFKKSSPSLMSWKFWLKKIKEKVSPILLKSSPISKIKSRLALNSLKKSSSFLPILLSLSIPNLWNKWM